MTDIRQGSVTYLLLPNTVGNFDPDQKVPVMIPADQAYYWTAEWQEGEREALADIAAGRVKSFDGDDPDDVIRWLQSDDD